MENQVSVQENDSISLMDLIYMFRRHLVSFIIFCVCGLALGIVYNSLQDPVYQSTTSILVSKDSNTTNPSLNDYSYSRYLSDTFVEFCKEGIVIDKTVEDLAAANIKISASELSNSLTVSKSQASLIIYITCVGNDAEKTKVILDVLNNNIEEIANKLDSNGDPVYKMLNGSIGIMTPAKEGSVVSHTLRNVAIFLVIGIVLGVAYIAIVEILNNKFKSNDEVERLLGVPVIANIPHYEIDKEDN